MFLSTLLLVATDATSSAFEYLRRHQPRHDRSVITDRALRADVREAMEARRASRWAADVPFDLFCEAVLPYACLDEPRGEWRPQLRSICSPLVEDASTTAEAALALNERLWDLLGVTYEPNLSPAILSPLDVMAHGRASCTGLSLLLVAACRSVGVPARLAGVEDWGDGSGNHAWVEIWAEGGWSFIGAAEPTPLNATWFAERTQRADGPRVFATSWAPTGCHFPVAWESACAADADDAAAAAPPPTAAAGDDPAGPAARRELAVARDRARVPAIERTRAYRAAAGV